MKLTRTLALSLVVAMSMPTFALATSTPPSAPTTTASTTTTAPGDATPVLNSADVVIPVTAVKEPGVVTEVDVANNTVTIQTDKKETIVLTTDKSTCFIDNTTKKANALKDIKKGETVQVWHNVAMTRSMPPQTHAQVIVSNIKENASFGQLYEVIASEKNKDGGYVLYNNDRDLYGTLPKTIATLPVYNSSATLSASNIKPGTKLIVWYDIVLTSFPAQTTFTSAMALPYTYDGYVAVDNDNKIVADGKTMQKPAVLPQKSTQLFVPVIEITRSLGYKSTWNSKTSTLTLKKDSDTIVFVKGQTTFTVNGDKYETEAPFITNKTLYVPASALEHIGNYKVVVPIQVV